METSTTIIFLILILLAIGFFFLTKSFLSKKKIPTNTYQTSYNTDGVPIIPRDRRDSLFTAENNIANIEADTSLHDSNLTDFDSQTDVLEQIDSLVYAEKQDLSKVSELNETLSSLERATANILPVSDIDADSFSGNSPLLDEHLQDQEQFDHVDLLENHKEIVSVTLLPTPNHKFDGKVIMEILQVYGLKFGEMDLYHRHVNPDGTGCLLFSVMRHFSDAESEPFDIETLGDEAIDGLVFFLPLPHPRPSEAIGGMLGLSGSISRDLEGSIHNQSLQVLSTEDKDELRDYVNQYS